jgi:hypothetical protein
MFLTGEEVLKSFKNENMLAQVVCSKFIGCQVTRVNSADVLDKGLRIGGRGHRMNSKVKVQTNKAKLDVCRE